MQGKNLSSTHSTTELVGNYEVQIYASHLYNLIQNGTRQQIKTIWQQGCKPNIYIYRKFWDVDSNYDGKRATVTACEADVTYPSHKWVSVTGMPVFTT